MLSILSFQFMNKKDFLKEIQEDTELITMSSTEKWIHENKISIESQLDEYGAVLFSDLPVKSAEDFDLFVSAFKYDTFTYEESLSNAVRINKTNKVFTANEAPSEIEIFLHHEMAQTPRYPKNIFFFCKSASQYGGETPLCRSDYLYAELLKEDANLISNGDELFSGQGRSWQKTLGVSFKEEAELKLKELGYSWHWLEEDNLSVTTKTLKAIKELKNGKKSFFNQVLAASLGWKKNKDNDISPVRFGNGEEICNSSLQMISSLAESLTLLRNWKEKDILLIDNHRVMHGRKPFSGVKNREILVSLTA